MWSVRLGQGLGLGLDLVSVCYIWLSKHTISLVVSLYNVEVAAVSGLSQRGDSIDVYRDRGGWPASLPYIRKIRVSVAIGTQSGIRLHQRVPMHVKIWRS